MAQEQAGWVNFQELKAKVSFEQLLKHFGIEDGLVREGEELTGLCPMCKEEGFKVNLAKNTFSCPGCKKRGSVIDFTSAYKKVGLKEAGVLLKELLQGEASGKSSGSRRGKRRRARAEAVKEGSPAPDSDRKEVVHTLKTLDAWLTQAVRLVKEQLTKLEGS